MICLDPNSFTPIRLEGETPLSCKQTIRLQELFSYGVDAGLRALTAYVSPLRGTCTRNSLDP